MALAAGINMMESRLLEVDGTKHFLTKRFDRNETGKLQGITREDAIQFAHLKAWGE
jgi:hypothetical protein